MFLESVSKYEILKLKIYIEQRRFLKLGGGYSKKKNKVKIQLYHFK
jgi:hypothetical protein